MIVPTPTSTARTSSETSLLLPWKPILSAGHAGGECDLELAARAHVDVQSCLDHPTCDLDAEERLARVVHARLGPVGGGRAGEGPVRLDRAGAGVLLVEHQQRRAEFGAQIRCVDAAEVQFAVAGAVGCDRPDTGGEVVRIVGNGQPLWREDG